MFSTQTVSEYYYMVQSELLLDNYLFLLLLGLQSVNVLIGDLSYALLLVLTIKLLR